MAGIERQGGKLVIGGAGSVSFPAEAREAAAAAAAAAAPPPDDFEQVAAEASAAADPKPEAEETLFEQDPQPGDAYKSFLARRLADKAEQEMLESRRKRLAPEDAQADAPEAGGGAGAGKSQGSTKAVIGGQGALGGTMTFKLRPGHRTFAFREH